MLQPKNELGLYRANPNALDTNALKLNDNCACGDSASCQDYVTGTVASARTVKSITYNDVVYPTSTGTLAKDGLKDFILGVIQNEAPTEDLDPIVEVTYEGTTLTVEHIGEGTLSVITYDDDSTSALTRKCDLLNLYKYNSVDAVGTVGPIQWGGNSATLANEQYTWSGTPATDAATATQLQTDIAAALTTLGVPNATVTVVTNDTDSEYTITVENTSNEPIKIGAVYVTLDEVVQQFF